MPDKLEEVKFSLFPKQFQAYELLENTSTVEVLGFGGAKGGGKSALSRIWSMSRREFHPGSRGLIIRESFPELERTHIQRLKAEIPADHATYIERRHCFDFWNGSILEVGYVEQPDDVKRLYWGAEYDDIVIDEAQNHKKETYLNLSSCLRTTRSDLRVKMLLTFNWGGIGHSWLVRMFWRKHMSKYAVEADKYDTWEHQSHWDENENPKKFFFLQSKVYDNPYIMKNDPEYVERLSVYPKEIREAYLDGEPMGLEGQFFTEFGTHLKEDPFNIEESDLRGNLYGSLDSGTTHPTSFGLWWLAGPKFKEKFGSEWTIHRLFTYLAAGGTIRSHADEIRSRIASFPWIKGHWPVEIAYDPSMKTKWKPNEAMVRSPIDEYTDAFGGLSTHFVPADNNRENGCQIMRMVMKGANDAPNFRYWDGFNASFEDGITAVVFDKNNREVYAKMDGDDIADESRYGAVRLWTIIGERKNSGDNYNKYKAHAEKMKQMDWKVL